MPSSAFCSTQIQAMVMSPYSASAVNSNVAVRGTRKDPVSASELAASLKRIWPAAMPKTHISAQK